MNAHWLSLAVGLFALVAGAAPASAQQAPSSDYPEPVLQWIVEEGETCSDVSQALYGGRQYVALLFRYNAVDCTRPLPPDSVLVVPVAITKLPTAKLEGSTPTVRAREPQGAWSPAHDGMPLDSGYGVNTLEGASADVLFRDRSRIYLQEHTLVVIYGSAEESVRNRTEPMRVELDEGELRAGIAALSGRTLDVETTGGGNVETESSDTVLRKKSDRTTVSVFDGHARVKSGGQTVKVEKNHGSSFVKAKPPTKARPLPPAPSWLSGVDRPVRLIRDAGTLNLSWSEVAQAVAYRVEVALDAKFNQVVVRERVPKDVRSLRAERLPPDDYYVRVRAEDAEDFLGIASPTAKTLMLSTQVEHGALQDDVLRISPYGAIDIAGDAGVELSTDGTTFLPLPRRVDFRAVHPSSLELRASGNDAVIRVPIVYETPRLDVQLSREGTQLLIALRSAGLAELQPRAQYRFWVEQETEAKGNRGQWVDLAEVTDAHFEARTQVDDLKATRVRLLDVRGTELGSWVLAQHEPIAAQQAPDRTIRLGVTEAVVPADPAASFEWWAARPASSLTLGTVAATDGHGFQLQGKGIANFEEFALSLRMGSNTFFSDALSEASFAGYGQTGFWFMNDLRWDFRLGVLAQATSEGPPTRLAGGTALGGDIPGTSLSWLSNLDGRFVVDDDDVGVPPWELHLGYGMTYQVSRTVRPYALLDAYFFADPARLRVAPQAGLEFGSRLVGHVGLRVSPWDDAGGIVGGALGVTLRQDPR